MPADPIAAAFLAAARQRLGKSLAMIEHCLAQLDEDDVHWRPFEAQNSVGNIVLHLCGNLGQWIVSGVGGAPDVRDRPREFADRTRFPVAALLEKLRGAVAESDAVLARLDPAALLEIRRIQGYEVALLPAIFDTVAHFEGHAQEITYVARLRLGERYVFRWVPATREQGAGPGAPAGRNADGGVP